MDLKPCPCGNEAHLIFEDGIKVADPWSISCKNPDCPWIFQTFTTIEEAVKCWNTRATDTLLKQMAEALVGMVLITKDSYGVSGYHLNGDIATWDEFDELNQIEQALQSYRDHINQIEKPECEGE